MTKDFEILDYPVFPGFSVERDGFFSPFRIARLGGALLLVVTAVLVLYTAPQQKDIVAAVIGFSLLGAATVLLTTNLLLAWLLRTKIEAQVLGPTLESLDNRVNAQESCKFLLALRGAKIPPLFFLRVKLIFGDDSPLCIEYLIGGMRARERNLEREVTFPFRGHWECQRVEFILQDQFGFTRSKWQRLPEGKGESVIVYPAKSSPKKLPFISSLKRAGDEIPDLQNRMGDLLEMKPYHPSDGLKRIIWKHYAKSGELISRAPEPSISPEGLVALYVLAGEMDDYTARQMIHYLTTAESAGLEIVCSCSGRSEEAPLRSVHDLENALISSVWETRHLQVEDIKRAVFSFIDGLPGLSNMSLAVGNSLLEGPCCKLLFREMAKDFSKRGISINLITMDNSLLLESEELKNLCTTLEWTISVPTQIVESSSTNRSIFSQPTERKLEQVNFLERNKL